MPTLFRNREDAGVQLAQCLFTELKGTPNLIILALPRGGLPVARPVADKLHAPLDIAIVRKLGMPQDPEYAIGAIADPDITELNADLIKTSGISEPSLSAAIQAQRQELQRRTLLYRRARPKPNLRNKNVVLVDDGLATGYTLRAAITWVKRQHPETIIAAVPVGSRQACNTVRPLVDQLFCLREPGTFQSVGSWYQDFSQVSDTTVCKILESAVG